MKIPEFVHIFTVGDHYSPKAGSSYATVIYELSRQHEARGGCSRIVVGQGTMEGYPPYNVGECIEVRYGAFPARSARLTDAVFGSLGLGRPVKWTAYRAACDAIDIDFDGWLIIHGEPAIVVAIRKARPRANILLYCHYDQFRWYTSREVRHVIDTTNATVCVSRYIARYVQQKAKVLSPKVFTVWNGIDATRFVSTGHMSSDFPIVLFVGRMCADKGPHLLVQAATLLKARGLQFRLQMVGSQYLGVGSPVSDYERELHLLAEPLKETIVFTPFVDRSEIQLVYQAATIFCAPSTWPEPFGLTLLEAMATALPIVASRRGAFPEIARDAALFFQPPDVSALADQIEILLRDERIRKEYGARARKRAEEFTWDKTYDQLISAMDFGTNVL
jgi:glycosyltransferase involved in cell wall biosynthesis